LRLKLCQPARGGQPGIAGTNNNMIRGDIALRLGIWGAIAWNAGDFMGDGNA
jgi:hypothetical protein